MIKGKNKVNNLRVILIWTNVALGVVALFFLLLAGAMVAYGKLYENRMFPGARVLGVRLDGMTLEESRKAVDGAIDAALGKGLRFKYKEQEVVLDATVVSNEADASRDLVDYDQDPAVTKAFELGRRHDWFGNVAEQMRMRVRPLTVSVDVVVDRFAITAALQSSLKAELTSVKNAELVLNVKIDPPSFSIQNEEKGVELSADTALDELGLQAKTLDFKQIELSDRLVTPTLTKEDLQPFVQDAENFLKRPSLAFTYEDQKFSVPALTLAGWISVTGVRSNLELTLSESRFSEDIKKIAPDVEQEARTGSLVVKNGKIESFVSGTEGRLIDAKATLAEVIANWPASSTFPLIVNTMQSKLIGEDPERLGIKELIGVGVSNFSGSPSNRRKNIAHGADQVNGTIIQPGETFSLLKTLGPIDAAHKWLPELVIKGNETKPEYGGGLCQIGTTTFRAALASGLPIVERRNHSYRVRYYEPAGTDATIYDPSPDFKFLNDTAHAILINAYIKGDEVIFEFWGTKDGRTVNQTKPRVYNISSPPAMKLIETLDLPPGKKKCTESAHAGADAEFTYTVIYPNGEVKEEVFRSHYRPWQAVCLVGVEKLSTPVAESPTGEAVGTN